MSIFSTMNKYYFLGTLAFIFLMFLLSWLKRVISQRKSKRVPKSSNPSVRIKTAKNQEESRAVKIRENRYSALNKPQKDSLWRRLFVSEKKRLSTFSHDESYRKYQQRQNDRR